MKGSIAFCASGLSFPKGPDIYMGASEDSGLEHFGVYVGVPSFNETTI